MGWLSLAGVLARILAATLKIVARKQLMDAGEARAAAAASATVLSQLDRVRRAKLSPAARRRVLDRLFLRRK